MGNWTNARLTIKSGHAHNDLRLITPFRDEMRSTKGAEMAQLVWR